MSDVRIITVTEEALATLVKQAVGQALSEHQGGETKPVLLDRERLAAALGCTASHVDTLRREGLPVVWLGQAPRFELQAVLDWLRGRKK